MKKVVLIVLMLFFAVTSYAAVRNLYDRFETSPQIKVFLKDVTTDVKDPNINLSVFKDVFKDVMAKRLNITFVPVATPEEADVIVTGEIKKYIFTKNAMPLFYSVASVVADTAAPKSQAHLTVDYKILSPKSERILLEFKNFTTQNRRPATQMNEGNAFKFAAEKNVNRFFYRAFYKQAER